MSEGLGPDSFDCSGLVIRSMCDVLGKDISAWQLKHRHVRDLWNAANGLDDAFELTSLAPGTLLVSARSYLVNNVTEILPGHIGIVTEVYDGKAVYIHASSPWLVAEEPVKNMVKRLGNITVHNL